jgi:glutathione S-transferase
MLTLCGFAVSNYYNKVKMALLEKEVAFAEKLVRPSQDEALLGDSPMGKVPYLETDQGSLCESEVIMAYLEDAYPAKPLLPKDAYARAKQRELVSYIELHMELEARQMYGEVFFKGARVDDVQRAKVEKNLKKSIAAFKRIAKFAPYVGGSEFGAADCSAYVSLPLIASASKTAFGSDLLADAGIDWKAHMKLISERPSALKVNADRKAFMEAQAPKS